MFGSIRVVAPTAMIAWSNVIVSSPTVIVWSSVKLAAPVVLGDAVLLHQEVHALDAPVRDLAAALPGRAVVEADGALDVDAERLLLVREDVRQFGVAQQRLRRDAADVQTDAAPVLLLDDGGLQPELSRPDRGDVPAGTRTQDHDIKVCAHKHTLGPELLRQELNRPFPGVRLSVRRGLRNTTTREGDAGPRIGHVGRRPVRRPRDQVSCLGIHDVLVRERVLVILQPPQGDLAQLGRRPARRRARTR